MTKELPFALLRSLEGVKGFDEKSFIAAHESPQGITSIRINPAKLLNTAGLNFPGLAGERVPWSKFGYYLSQRPSFTFDPLFHAGCYYVQEASSMFLEQVITQWTDLSRPVRVLDLSAAPGGKSTHLQSLISKNSLLVSNEVIRSRARILEDQIIKWGASNVVVTNNDPRDFSALEGYFDIVVLDAPCSGSGLFRRDPNAMNEWSPDNVQLCSQRQQRILADIWPALRNGGLFIYSTCSYSAEEDEEIASWIRKEFDTEDLKVTIREEWGIIETSGGYRFWPGRVKGEGFYMAAFIKKDGRERLENWRSRKKIEKLTEKEKGIAGKWMNETDAALVRNEEVVYAWPLLLQADIEFILSNLRVLYSGTRIGELVRDKMVPDHALALSGYLPEDFPHIELDKSQAIDYLSKKDLHIEIPARGWQVVRFEGHGLGWINVLSNRINNYYPKELRILKDNTTHSD